MEQRRLRLGDILDDYCPRERRVTNHAVVAMVEETVKQTRCSTCDTEHPYKGGHAPRRKKKETSSALYKEVLAGKPDTDLPVGAVAGEAHAIDEAADGDAVNAVDAGDAVAPAQAATASDDASDDVDTEEVAQPILSRPTIVARREVAPEPPAPQIAGAAPGAIPDASRRRRRSIRRRRGRPGPSSVDSRAAPSYRRPEGRAPPDRFHHPATRRAGRQPAR